MMITDQRSHCSNICQVPRAIILTLYNTDIDVFGKTKIIVIFDFTAQSEHLQSAFK